jgi:AcrR family transcriptional regulator
VASAAEIVAAIRQRISSGELKPGDRVPSVREITRRWGVAMATATRVLASLRQEGLVVARPGIGTVVVGTVSGPVSSPVRRVPDVGLPDVVRTAIGIADAEGSAALSMRRVATGLGVATMSLYRHVDGKDDLLTRMVDAVFGEHRFTVPPPDDWLTALEIGARSLWRMFRRHPWAAQVLSLTRPQATPNALAFSEWVMRPMHAAGLPPTRILQVHLTLVSYVRGLAVSLEAEAAAEQETGVTYSEFVDAQDATFSALTASGAFPTFEVVAAASDFALDLDEQFEFGLRHLLAGLAGLPVVRG